MEIQLENIWFWYEDQVEALIDLKYKIQSEMATQKPRPKFVEFSSDELNEYFSNSLEEIEHLTCFNLISATEAALRIDFNERTNRRNKKNKKGMGRLFREIQNDKGRRIRLDDDILESWKKEVPEKKKYFSDFLGILEYRHWLAHGRYWTPNLGQQYTVQSTYKIAEKVLNTLREL